METVNTRQIKNLMGLSRHRGKAGVGGNGAGREGRLVLAERAAGSSSNPTAPREGKQMLWIRSWKCNHWAGSFPRAQGTFGGTRWKFRTSTIPLLAGGLGQGWGAD